MTEPWNEKRSPFDPANPLSGILDSPEMRRERLWDTLGNLSVALIQAGAPSRTPGSFIGALGAGLAGNTSGGEDRLMRRAMLGMQAAKTQAELDRKKAWQQLAAGPDAAAAPAPAPDGGAMPAVGAPPQQAAEMVDYLTKTHGLPPTQAAVVVGNLLQESNLNPTATHDGGTGYGLAGWRLDRRDALNRYAQLKGGNVADPRLQADFLVDELKGRPEWSAFSQAQDPAAANLALINYFRPRGWTPDNPAGGDGFDRRLQLARSLLPGGGPQVAQGDASVIPAQATGQPQPRSLREVMQALPPGIRQIIGTMDPDAGMQVLLKYGYMTPAEQERLTMDRERLRLQQSGDARDERKFGYQVEKDRRTAAGQGDPPSGWRPGANGGLEPIPGGPAAIEAEERLRKREADAKKEGQQTEQQTFSNEKALRNEFESQPAVKSFRVVVPMLESAKDAATRPTRAADLNLVYAFAKLMDPDSVVRESETGAVVATASVADRVAAYVNQLNGQAMLSPETRTKLLAELDSRYNALKASHDALAGQYGEIAKAYNIEPGRVVIPIRGSKAPADGGNQPTQEELKGWSEGVAKPATRFLYVPGKGLVKQ